MEKIIIVDTADRDMVQKADIEVSSRMNLISFMLSRNMDTNTDYFKRYEKEYQECFLAFEQAKTYIFNKYVKDEKALSWSLNYETCQLTISH